MNSTKETSEFTGTIHLVFSTHWDREWYLPFQKFRAKLVHVMDGILANLESGHLPFYQLDGQFIPVEDYLEIRPEKEALIRRFVESGRLRLGPWYNLPDGFLVSGESMVRNFLMGMARSEAFGQTSRVGWLCDIFGHNSQTPQILQGLGIEAAILWRGVDTKLGSPFVWTSPDGTSVLTHWFPRDGYSDFGFKIRTVTNAWERLSVEDLTKRGLEYLRDPALTQSTQNRLWFDGADHIHFDPLVVDAAAAINRELGREVVVVSTLDRYLEALAAENTPDKKTWEGEMREACPMDSAGWMIPGVASSRIPLKRANHAGETILTLWAEPWCARAAVTNGFEYPATALELAWEYLLKNHPHDSICGCSPDETHADMPYRFAQSHQLAELHLEAAFQLISAGEFNETLGEKEIGLSLFTPAGGAVQHRPEVTVKLPGGWPQFNEFFGFETKPSFRILDQAGSEVRYQLLEVIPRTNLTRVPQNKFPSCEGRQGVRIALDLEMAANEVRHLRVVQAEGPTRIPEAGRIGVARDRLKNEFLEVLAKSDGTLSLTEIATGRTYSGLLTMEDTADIGDGWYHGMAVQESGFLSTGGNVTFGLTENGPLLARLKIRVEWLVPKEFDFAVSKRSPEFVPLVVEHLVTLRKGSAQLEVTTTVHNTVRDHRLRIFCPTDFAKAETFWADTPFDAVERPIKLREDNHELRELQVEMTPQQNWVAVQDGKAGLALLAPGQYESAVLDQPDRPLCLTLLRAFRRAVFTDGNEGGQIQGSHAIQLGIRPFKPKATEFVDLFNAAQSIAAPVRSVFLERTDLSMLIAKPEVRAAVVPKIEGSVVVSAQYQSVPNEWIFRIFNPESSPANVKLIGGSVWEIINSRGENAQKIAAAKIEVKAKQILTLKCRI